MFGLPGHPQAAFFTAKLYVCAMLRQLQGSISEPVHVPAVLSHAVSANDGRELYMPVRFSEKEDRSQDASGLSTVIPLHGKSGLIKNLSLADGYICIPRNREGYAAGEMIDVVLF